MEGVAKPVSRPPPPLNEFQAGSCLSVCLSAYDRKSPRDFFLFFTEASEKELVHSDGRNV